MKYLSKTVSDSSLIRWSLSAGCTFCIILPFILLPSFFQRQNFTASDNLSETAVSLVTVTQKHQIKAVEIEKTKIQEEKKIIKEEAEIKKVSEVKQNQEKIKEELEELEDALPEENLSEEEKLPEEKNLTEDESLSNTENDSTCQESAGTYSNNPVESEEIQKAKTSYKSYVLSRIASKKQYPVKARSKGLEGKVRVHLEINPDGSISDCEIIKACQYDILNEACLTAIKKAAPFKEMSVGMQSLVLNFTMDFSLK
ncbi:MAG: TonB family protein [Treponema sp.]|nr:TonB family protein [Treponema sp.]